jgi:DNA replication and repair protein RecF
MRIKNISLENFRIYRDLDLELPPGPTLLHGDNAQGKTNLLEAIYYLATTRSPHADRGRQLINWEKLDGGELIIVGRIVAKIEIGSDSLELEMRLIREFQNGRYGFRREALVNHRKVRLMDLLGKLRVVLFLPQDLAVITGSPSVRRRYIDITLCQSDPSYCRALSTYNKVLEQRNALLRQIAEDGSGLDVLPVYSDKLVDAGSVVFRDRAQALSTLDELARDIHQSRLTRGEETVSLCYLPRFAYAINNRNHEPNDLGTWLSRQDTAENVADRFQQELANSRSAELAAAITLVGPHRDDWRFEADGKDLSKFGSRGQQRTALLALKLAEIQWMTEKTGAAPILLLDEVVAELDRKRREFLLSTVQEASQSILTATDPSMFSSEFLTRATSMRVSGGRIVRQTHGPVGPG